MKKTLYFIILIPLVFGCANGQKLKMETTEGFKFIVDHFEEGNYKADLMTGSENMERREELLMKMQSVIKTDFEWYVEFVKGTTDGMPDRYDKRLGLTEEEFSELRGLINTYRGTSELEFNITIKKEGSLLKFISDYEKEFFESFEIDLMNQKVYLGSFEFAVTDTINKTDDKNRLASKWKGYEWTYQQPEKIDFSNVAELVRKDAVLYRIKFGLLQPSEKLYLSIKGVGVKNGIQKMNFSIPILMKK